MIAFEGRVKNNKIVLNNDISAYDGNTVIVTILDRRSIISEMTVIMIHL